MTDRRLPNSDQFLVAWFEDGPTTMPDRVIDVVAVRIGRQRQRRSWRLLGRPLMHTYAKVALAAAAVVIVAVVGFNLLPKGPSVGTPTAPPSPTAGPVPSATAAAGIRDVPAAGGRLDPGDWRFRIGSGSQSLSVVATVPAGWLGNEHGLENAIATNSAPSGIAVLFEMPGHGAFSDPCHWNVDGSGNGGQRGDVTVGPKVADLVAALRANTSFASSTPTAVAFGPYAGQQLELTFPADLDPATCDRDPSDDSGTYRVMPDTIYSQGPGNVWTMSIIDVAGTRVVVIIEHFPGTNSDKFAEARAIVSSFVFSQ